MKLQPIFFSLLAVSLLLNLTSCDGGKETAGLTETDNLTAESLDQLVIGETINYTTSDNTAPILGNLTFDSNTRATINQQFYDYAKTSQFQFTITRSSSQDIYTTFATALDNTLMDNGTNSQLGSRLRELLHRNVAVYTPDELREISSILSPSGTSTSVSAAGILVARLDDKYTHLVTSNKLTQARGTMAGTYYLNSNVTDIGFRRPVNDELVKYRFITLNDWIPYVTGKTSLVKVISRGTWTLELHNLVS